MQLFICSSRLKDRLFMRTAHVELCMKTVVTYRFF